MFRLKPFLMTASIVGSLFGFACGPVSAQVAPVQPAPTALQGPEQRVALVIGNSNYQNAPQLANPDNDAQSMAQFLNSAGFEVVAATDLTQNDMLRVVQDFSAKVSARGPNTVAMVYYAGHGVQLAGEIARAIKARRLTQEDAAALLGIDQSKVSRITRGQFRGVSEAKLLELVARLGHDVKIVVGPVRRRAGKIELQFA